MQDLDSVRKRGEAEGPAIFAPPTEEGLTDIDRLRFERLLREKMVREMEATNLYEPLPNQLAFHKSQARERLLRGSNRAGKTLAASTEIAWIVANRHPHIKYPKSGKIIAVGRSEEHIGNVMWDKLSREQPNFRRIKDLETGQWRAYRPWSEKDRERKDESKTMTPLVPTRLLDGEPSWYSKKDRIPRRVRFKTGWELMFFTGGGSPPQGMDVDVCLAGWSMIYDPVAKVHRRIDEIDGPFHVWSYNETKKVKEIRRATKPFIKGFGEIVDVRLSNGETIYTTRKHQVLSTSGEWVSIQHAFEEETPLPRVEGCSSASIPSQPLTLHNQNGRQSLGLCASGTGRTVRHETNCEANEPLCGLVPNPSDESRLLAPSKRIEPCAGLSQDPRRFSLVHAPRKAQSERLIPSRQVAHAQLRLQASPLVCEPSRLSCERDTEQHQDSSGTHQQFPGAISSRREPLTDLRSFSTSRQGEIPPSCGDSCVPREKSTQDCQSRCSAGLHPCGEHARLEEAFVRCASPSQADAQESDHSSMRLGDLASATRHSHTMSQLETSALVQDSPSDTPVFVEGIRSLGEFLIWDISVEVNHNYVNGGVVNHNCWFDEEIENNNWYLEMAARLLDRGGRFFWSATAQAGGDQLWRLHQRAMEEEGDPKASVTEHPILLFDNPHIEQWAKEELAKKYAHDPDAYRVRILGEYLITSFHIYPTFAVTRHVIEPFEIPDNWCRYMIVDPGTVVAAALFVAVPPDQSHLYVYDEMYLRDSNPEKWSHAIKHKTDGQVFQEFIIDDNGSRRGEATSGTNVRDVYSDILKSLGVKSRGTGSSFRLGQSNVQAGLDQVRKALIPKPKSKTETPYLQIFHTCQNLIEEFPRYYKKRNKVTGVITEDPVQKNNHALDCLRYAVMHGCQYVKPQKIKKHSNGKKRWDEKRKRNKKPSQGILLGAKGK